MIKILLMMSLLSSFVMTFLGVVLMLHLDISIGLLILISGCFCMLRTFYHINNQRL